MGSHTGRYLHQTVAGSIVGGHYPIAGPIADVCVVVAVFHRLIGRVAGSGKSLRARLAFSLLVNLPGHQHRQAQDKQQNWIDKVEHFTVEAENHHFGFPQSHDYVGNQKQQNEKSVEQQKVDFLSLRTAIADAGEQHEHTGNAGRRFARVSAWDGKENQISLKYPGEWKATKLSVIDGK